MLEEKIARPAPLVKLVSNSSGVFMRLLILFSGILICIPSATHAEGSVVRLAPGKGDPLAADIQATGHLCPEMKLYQSIKIEESYQIARVWCGPKGNRNVDLDMDYRLTFLVKSDPEIMYVKPWED